MGTVFYSHSIVTIVVSCIISEIKRDIGRKSRVFHSPFAYDVSVTGEFPLEYCHYVWYGKTRMVWLPDDEKKYEDMFSRSDTISTCNGQGDGWTDGHLATA